MNSKIRWAWAIIALCVGAAIVMFLTSRLPAPPLEVLRSELMLADGKLHRIGDTNLFNGWMVELYTDGVVRSRSQVANGLLNGVSEGWSEDGQLVVRETFSNNISNGLRTKWHPNGTKLSEATIENGKVVGEFKRWHDNGELAELLRLKDGEPEGESWAFYPSGYARAMTRHENGSLVHRGAWRDGEHKVTFAQ